MGVFTSAQRQPLNHFNTVFGQGVYFARVVGHQLELADTEVITHDFADTVIAHIRMKAELFIGLNRISAFILQFVGADLVQQTNTPPFLTEIKQRAAPLGGNLLQRGLELRATVTAHAEQGIAGQALGVHPTQHRLVAADIAQGEHNVLFVIFCILKTMDIENAPRGGQFRGFDKPKGHAELRPDCREAQF